MLKRLKILSDLEIIRKHRVGLLGVGGHSHDPGRVLTRHHILTLRRVRLVSKCLLVAGWSALHRVVKPVDVPITSKQLLLSLTLNIPHLLHQLHLSSWIRRSVLESPLHIHSLRILHGSVHNRLMVKRTRDDIHSLLLVLVMETVLLKQPFIRTHVLSLKPHPRVDRLETVNDVSSVLSSLPKTSPFV